MESTEPVWCVFDAFGTLIFPEPDAATVYHRLGHSYGDTRSLDAVRHSLNQALAKYLRPVETGATNPDLERQRWRSVVDAVFGNLSDRTALFSELWNYFALPESWRVFDDVGPCLSQLTDAGVKLCIASNFDLRLLKICQGISLLDRVAPVLSSAQLGWRKPAREFFEAIEFRLGTPPDRLWMVGDDWELDALPARSHGWHSVHLDRRQSKSPPAVVDGISCLHSLAQLSALLIS
jgi:putative hydrolase of the HAD superfamily